MLRHGLVVGIACALLAAPAAAEVSEASWAQADITLATAHGLFAGVAAIDQPSAALTEGALAVLVGNLTASSPVVSTEVSQPVSMSELDAALVDALGLGDAAARFQQVAERAGLAPPARFGTEVVARLLGLRTTHPASQPSLSLQPDQAATMAEAAFSAARVLSLAPPPSAAATPSALSPSAAAAGGGGVAYVRMLAASFAIPTLTPWQTRVLSTAVALIGYPYFPGGDNQRLSPGFDCSGFVWRVYNLTHYQGAPQLARTLTGRSASAMAEAVPPSERIARADIEPGDVLYFGAGPHSAATQIFHTAIALGNGWLIESSNEGVSLGRLSWFGPQFAWAQRPLAQAGLAAQPSSSSPPTAA